MIGLFEGKSLLFDFNNLMKHVNPLCGKILSFFNAIAGYIYIYIYVYS